MHKVPSLQIEQLQSSVLACRQLTVRCVPRDSSLETRASNLVIRSSSITRVAAGRTFAHGSTVVGFVRNYLGWGDSTGAPGESDLPLIELSLYPVEPRLDSIDI